MLDCHLIANSIFYFLCPTIIFLLTQANTLKYEVIPKLSLKTLLVLKALHDTNCPLSVNMQIWAQDYAVHSMLQGLLWALNHPPNPAALLSNFQHFLNSSEELNQKNVSFEILKSCCWDFCFVVNPTLTHEHHWNKKQNKKHEPAFEIHRGL